MVWGCGSVWLVVGVAVVAVGVVVASAAVVGARVRRVGMGGVVVPRRAGVTA